MFQKSFWLCFSHCTKSTSWRGFEIYNHRNETCVLRVYRSLIQYCTCKYKFYTIQFWGHGHHLYCSFILFKDYRIPRESLLNRTADVTPEGDYESCFSDPGRILGAALENLSMGRVGIMQESSNQLICAVTVAVRYAAVRKQFAPNGESGTNNKNELPIIEYQLHVSTFFFCTYFFWIIQIEIIKVRLKTAFNLVKVITIL